MKPLRISTAMSILLLSTLAPQVLAVGDPNLDTGVGSASSRGPFGFSNNNDAIFDTPVNTYGIYRDAHGGLRDRGMISDNLTTRVPEPTWEETHAARGPIPGGGAPGGFGGGFGGGIGGIPVGAGLGGIPFGAGFGALAGGFGTGALVGGGGILGGVGGALGATPLSGFASIGFNGTGPAAAVPRTATGFLGTPGTFFNNWPVQGRYMGRGSGFIPQTSGYIRNTTETVNGLMRSDTHLVQQTPMGPLEQRVLRYSQPDGANHATGLFSFNGHSWTGMERLDGFNGGPQNIGPDGFFDSFVVENSDGTTSRVRPVIPRNYTQQFTGNFNNDFTNPFLPNTRNSSIRSNQLFSGGNFGAGFATPQTSGDARSYFFSDTQATGNLGGFATPQSSGSAQSVYFPSNLESSGTLGSGFATPATSGSERSVAFPSPTNNIGTSAGLGFGGFSTGVGGTLGTTGLGGIAAGSGNRAGMSSVGSGAVSGELLEGEDRSDGSIARQGRAVSGSLEVENMERGYGPAGSGIGGYGPSSALPGGSSVRLSAGLPNLGRTMRGGTGTNVAVFGPLTPGGGELIGTMGSRLAVGPADIGPVAGADEPGFRRVIPPTEATPTRSVLGPYVRGRGAQTRFSTQSRAVAPLGPIGNIGTQQQYCLSLSDISPERLGQVLGSMRLENGDIITYGSKATLHLTPDNSGSITFNSGEIVVFRQAGCALRNLALRSTLLM